MRSNHLGRREFVTLLGGAAAWPLAARAQQPDRMRRVSLLLGIAENDPEARSRIKAFQQGLRDLGWTEGHNVRFEYRWPADDARLNQGYATEIVSLAPDVILIGGQPAFDAIREATRTIPVVFVQVTDPVGSGLVASLARPGGNLTGFANYESMGGKWLGMLKEIAPGVTQVAVVLNPDSASNIANVHAIEAAALSLGIPLTLATVRDAADIEPAIAAFAGNPRGGLIVLASPTTAVHRELIVALAARHRLPAVYPYRWFVTDGGLLSYGIDTIDLYRRAASYVDRILKGDKPGDLPIQQPTKFELVINLKTATALGLTVPLTLQAAADEVIE